MLNCVAQNHFLLAIWRILGLKTSDRVSTHPSAVFKYLKNVYHVNFMCAKISSTIFQQKTNKTIKQGEKIKEFHSYKLAYV